MKKQTFFQGQISVTIFEHSAETIESAFQVRY